MRAAVLFFLVIGLKLIASAPSQNNSSDVPLLQYGKIGEQRCMDDLGCFVITKDYFHPIYRPLNLLPQDRATINTEFHLYTKNNPMDFDLVKFNDPKSMKTINIKHRTVFIVHGFIDSKYYGKWMENLKDGMLIHSDFNVILVDWSKGNGAPYAKASANGRVVGAEMALLIKSLEKNIKLDPMTVHIIGHSLGAHIAGLTGDILKRRLGRITALDPAAPYFQYMPTSVRLDPLDADFVDAIHTDASSITLFALGMTQTVGHVDFFPNNGMKQPGCSTAAIHSIFLDGLVEASRRFASCNHQRSCDFFLFSINHKRPMPVGVQCTSWQDYLDGLCADCSKNRCAVMGMAAEQFKPYKNDKQSAKMYLATSTKSPFWEYAFQVTVKLFKPKSGVQDKKGTINLKITGSQNSYDAKLPANDLKPGATYNFLVRNKDPLGDIKGVTFKYTSSAFGILSTQYFYLDNVTIKPMNVGDEAQQKQQTKKFCNKGQAVIKSKSTTTLTVC